jgi:hypothetical protein
MFIKYRCSHINIYFQVCYFRGMCLLLRVLQWTIPHSRESDRYRFGLVNGRHHGGSSTINNRWMYTKWISDNDPVQYSIDNQWYDYMQSTLDFE